jgi:GTPase
MRASSKRFTTLYLCQSSDSVADLAPGTQLHARPPNFILIGNQLDALPVSYECILMNGLRQSFGLPGVPIRISKKTSGNPFAEKKTQRR